MRKELKLLTCVLCIGIFIFGCSSPQELEILIDTTPHQVFSTIQIDATPYVVSPAIQDRRPEFILDVNPIEDSSIPLSFYNAKGDALFPVMEATRQDGLESMICVEPNLRKLVEEGDQLLHTDDILDRMELYVNGSKTVTKQAYGLTVLAGTENVPVAEWIDGAEYCWLAPLSVGTNQVEFKFHRTSKDVELYTWQFEIFELN